MYEKRFIAVAATIFAIGVAGGIVLNNRYTFTVCAVFAILAVVSVAFLLVNSKIEKKFNSKRITAIVFTVAALSFGVLRVCLQDNFNARFNAYNGVNDTASIRITEITDSHVDGKIINSATGIPKGTDIRVYISQYNEQLLTGDTIICDLKYKYTDTNTLRSKGINLTSSCEVISVERGMGIFYTIRENINKNSKVLFERFQNVSGITKGITVGDRSEISSFTYALYRNAGISHLLAISGLHISIIVMSLYNSLIFLSINRKISGILSSFVALMFAALVGFSAGATRSAIMISATLLFGVFLKRSDSLTSLFSVFLLFLIINPYSICGVGLQLSFACCLGLLLASPLTQKINYIYSMKIIKSNFPFGLIYKLCMMIIIPVVTSSIASIFSFPIIFANFDTTSAIAPIVNIFAIPLFSLAVELAIIAYIFASFSVKIATLFSLPSGCLINFITEAAKAIYNRNFGVVSIHSSYMVIPLLLSIASVVILLFIGKKRNTTILFACAIFIFMIPVCGLIGNYSKTIEVIEYGCDNNSEYLYFSKADNDVYIDVGGYSVYPTVIYENGNLQLENYVAVKYNSRTHQHIDRITSEIKVDKLILPTPKNASDIFWLDSIKLLANERECDIIYFQDDCVLEFPNDAEIQVIYDENIGSVTVYLDMGYISVQLLGDRFNQTVKCDYAIVTDRCETEVKNINAKEIYAQNDYAYKNSYPNDRVRGFDSCLRIEVNTEESSCRIYEP